MKVIIFGDYEKWAAAVDLIERKCTDVTDVGCCDPFRLQLSDHFSASYTTQQMGDAFMEGEIDGQMYFPLEGDDRGMRPAILY